MRQLFLAVWLSAVTGALLASPAAAQVAPDLGGETFHAEDWERAGQEDITPGSVTFASRRCEPDGSGHLAGVADGPAVGPYTGDFHESFRFEFGPSPSPGSSGDTTSAEARFTIDSEVPPARVIGRKSLLSRGFALCETIPPGENTVVGGDLRYEALIRTEDGTFLDRGSARAFAVKFVHQIPGTLRVDRFIEQFVTDGVPPIPFTKQDCKDEEFAALVGALFGDEKECKDFVKDKDEDPVASP